MNAQEHVDLAEQAIGDARGRVNDGAKVALLRAVAHALLAIEAHLARHPEMKDPLREQANTRAE